MLAGAAGVPSAVAGDSSQQLMQAAHGILEAHRAQLSGIRAAFSPQQQGQGHVDAVATGGTVTTLAALHLRLSAYEHEAVHMTELSREHIHKLMQQFLRDEKSRSSWPDWLSEARAAALVPGCAGLLVLMDWLGVDSFVVSDCDLLDGSVAEMQQQT
jgi:exopolyphosphatase/pppGpp-phosphohydrolase